MISDSSNPSIKNETPSFSYLIDKKTHGCRAFLNCQGRRLEQRRRFPPAQEGAFFPAAGEKGTDVENPHNSLRNS